MSDEERRYCDNHKCGRLITKQNPVVAIAEFAWGVLIFCKACSANN